MFIINNFFAAIAEILHFILTLYIYIIIARAVLSWVNPNPYNQFVLLINRLTEPPLAWIRKLIPATVGGFDLSPVILVFAVIFIDRFVVSTLRQIASF